MEKQKENLYEAVRQELLRRQEARAKVVSIGWLENYCKENRIWDFSAFASLRTGDLPLDIISVGGKESVNLIDVKKLLEAARKQESLK